MIIRIRIGQEEIDRGDACDCYLCPGALAINRCLADDCYSVVGDDEILIEKLGWGPECYCKVKTPQILTDFIDLFDRCGAKRVQPIEFDLDIPRDFLKV